MRLATLIAELPDEQLERLEGEHLGEGERVSRATLCATLESVLRSYSFVRRFVGDRFPPTFAILELLLEADGHAVPASGFREAVEERTRILVDRVTSGDLVGRDDGLRLYRRVFLEARRNDLVLDASETAILGVLRSELKIRTVEHFLIEHHADFHGFWMKGHAFLDQMNALRTCGLVFGHEGTLTLAEEVAPLVRQTLGFEMASASRRRLYDRLSGSDLSEVLGTCDLKTSGSRDEKLERLLASYIQPSEAIRALSLQTIRDLCRDVKATVSGSKDELVDRLVHHQLHDLDVKQREVDEPKHVEPEPRALDEARFRGLFTALRGEDLSDILAEIDSSRVTGDKDRKVTLLSKCPHSESTLLQKLTNRALEEILDRLRLRTAGSKVERVDRLVDHFRTVVFASDPS